MDIIYYIINFAILLGIIALFFRKTIISLFRDRRIKIEKELDETISKSDTVGEIVMPEITAIDRTVIEEAKKTADEKLSRIRNYGIRECREITLENLNKVRDFALGEFKKEVRKKFLDGGYSEVFAKKCDGIAENILSKIKLTAGDMSYLKHHSVLYVTLTSAEKLDDDIVKKFEEKTSALLDSVGGKTSFWVKIDEDLIGGLCLRIGDTVYDGSVSEKIYRFKAEVQKRQVTENDTVQSLLSYFFETAKLKTDEIYTYQLGRVISVSDGICWMDGLADIMYGEVVEFDCGERGMVLDIQRDKIGCVIFGSYEHIESYTRVRRVGRMASVPVGNGLLGRVVDAIGHPLDGKGHIKYTERRPIEFGAPAILDREKVNSPLHTGIKAIDALVPIGKGQRELIIGDRQTGKTSVVLDTILSQKGKNVICIYVAIGQKETSVSDFKEKLEKYGALDYTVIVAATASGSAAMQYMAPFAGTAIGEYFMYSGHDVLIAYDDLSKHAVAYRELSLLLQRPSGREAYPGDIFYLHSRLLERSAHLSAALGGGSMTALPIIETQAGDISSYIPTNVISITDGQIFLESELFREGQRPAVNVGLSVSRVGGSAQTKLMKQVSSNLRTQLAQYRELAEFTQFGTDIDDETNKTLNSGKHLTEALKQPNNRPLDDWKQSVLLYAVSEGFCDSMDIKFLPEFETALFFAVENNADAYGILSGGNKLTDDGKALIGKIVSEVAARF